MTRHRQIGEREQADDLPGVLLESAIVNFGETKLSASPEILSAKGDIKFSHFWKTSDKDNEALMNRNTVRVTLAAGSFNSSGPSVISARVDA